MKLTSLTAEWALKLKLSIRIAYLRVLLLLEHDIFEFDNTWRDVGKLIIFVLTVATRSVARRTYVTLSVARMWLSLTRFSWLRKIWSLPNGGGLIHLLIFCEFVPILTFGRTSTSIRVIESTRGPSRSVYCNWSSYWRRVVRILRKWWLQRGDIPTSIDTRSNWCACFAKTLCCHKEGSLLCINFTFSLLTRFVIFCPLLIRSCSVAPSNPNLNSRVLNVKLGTFHIGLYFGSRNEIKPRSSWIIFWDELLFRCNIVTFMFSCDVKQCLPFLTLPYRSRWQWMALSHFSPLLLARSLHCLLV